MFPERSVKDLLLEDFAVLSLQYTSIFHSPFTASYPLHPQTITRSCATNTNTRFKLRSRDEAKELLAEVRKDENNHLAIAPRSDSASRYKVRYYVTQLAM